MILTLVARRSSFLLLELLALSSCGDKVAEKQAVTIIESKIPSLPSPNTNEVGTPAVQSTNAEYLEWSTASLNGRLPMMSAKNAILKELGPLDSLTTTDMNEGCGYFFDQPHQDAYVKMTELEICNDTAVIRTIDFQRQPQLTLQTGKIRLNSNTTLLELANTFPMAVKAQNEMNVDELGKVVAVSLATGPIVTDDSWLLFFQRGKLVRIDYFIPC